MEFLMARNNCSSLIPVHFDLLYLVQIALFGNVNIALPLTLTIIIHLLSDQISGFNPFL